MTLFHEQRRTHIHRTGRCQEASVFPEVDHVIDTIGNRGCSPPRPWPAERNELWPIDRLIRYATNPRLHTEADIGKIEASIQPLATMTGTDGSFSFAAALMRASPTITTPFSSTSTGIVHPHLRCRARRG